MCDGSSFAEIYAAANAVMVRSAESIDQEINP